MRIRKRVIAAIFHIVVAAVYLIMWIFKWSSVSEMQQVVIPTDEKVWHSPASTIITEVMQMNLMLQDCFISIYDDIFLRVSNELDTDWRLMCAIGYTESRFHPYIRSHSGAIGIMQIMPRTAAIYGASVDMALDPELNIRIALQHYNLIEYMLDMPDMIEETDRFSLNLAGYHGGIGRVRDAQRLARHAGEDPYSWSAVAQQLVNLQDPEFYELPMVRNGKYRSGGYTVSYVDKVMRRYKKYCIQTTHCIHHLYPVTGHGHYY